MKKLLVLLTLFSTIVGFSQNIEGTITYVSSAEKASAFLKEKYKDDKEKLKERENNPFYKNTENVYFKLKFNSTMSLYEIVDKLNINTNDKFNFAKIVGGSNNKFFTTKNVLTSKNETLNCELLGECFLIENELQNWELEQETKEIQGFLCYKAILKNKKTNKVNTVAWYTPSIPYQYGITNYYGLPGVILEIERNTYVITATKIELNPFEKVVIDVPPTNIKKLTQKEFQILARKSMPDFFKEN